MCSIEEVHAELKPLKDSLTSLTKRFNGLMLAMIIMLIGFLGTLFFIGSSWGQVKNDVAHNREMLITRTEDRFYKQDGDILEEKLKGLVHRQEYLETQYNTIDAKLDRLIESR